MQRSCSQRIADTHPAKLSYGGLGTIRTCERNSYHRHSPQTQGRKIKEQVTRKVYLPS